MDPNGNRLHLNFGNNDRLPVNDRAYPTTPSTFPQPVFSPPNAQQGQGGGLQPQQQQQQQQAYAGGYAPQGYFAPPGAAAAYPAGYPAQSVNNEYAHAHNGYYQARSNTPGTNDPNTGLAHQFSHQNLGGAGRVAPRGPSPSQRPRTAGSQPGAYASYSNAPPMPTQSTPAVADFQAAPERNPDRYGTNANSNQKKCSQLAADFFKDSVKRARERNQRYFWAPRCIPRPCHGA
jgi:protein-serine/threonine kinase